MNIEIPVINIKNGSVGIGVLSTTASFKLQVSGTIGPSDNAVFNLGSVDKKWANGYINNVIGTSSLATTSGRLIVANTYEDTSHYLLGVTNTAGDETVYTMGNADITINPTTKLLTVTSSWANNALSASWAPDVTVTVNSASWASSSISASYAPVQPSYSASVSTALGTKQNTLVTGGTYTITSSWATNATTSSFALNVTPTISASWASSSISASYVNGKVLTNNFTASNGMLVSSGNVGILTSPSYPLDVSGVVNTSNYYQVDGVNARVVIGVDGVAGNGYGFFRNSNGVISTRFNTDGNPSYILSSSFGIGTITPGATLHVQGNISASSITASLKGTASWATNAVNANNIIKTGSGNVISSSYRTLGSKAFTFGTAYATGSSINMSVSQSAVLKIYINGWWPGTGSIGYQSEYFLQNSGVARPGVILRQDNNNGDGIITTQLNDNLSGNVFDILFKTSGGTISNSILSYEVIGQVNSIT